MATVNGNQTHIMPTIKEAAQPSRLLFGEIFGTKLHLPHLEPTKYATESDTQVNIVMFKSIEGA